MDTKLKLRALGLALTLVVAAAGTGWALQVPLTAAVAVSHAQEPGISMPDETPRLSLLAWPQAAVPAEDEAPVGEHAAAAGDIDGLEEMSATGAAAQGRAAAD